MIYNSITNKDIRDLALNREIVRNHDKLFSHKIDVKGITNQKSSGRCWLFAGLNSLRYAVIDKHKLDEFEFSQIYFTFWDKLEKSNTFLEYIIDFRSSLSKFLQSEAFTEQKFDFVNLDLMGYASMKSHNQFTLLNENKTCKKINLSKMQS